MGRVDGGVNHCNSSRARCISIYPLIVRQANNICGRLMDISIPHRIAVVLHGCVIPQAARSRKARNPERPVRLSVGHAGLVEELGDEVEKVECSIQNTTNKTAARRLSRRYQEQLSLLTIQAIVDGTTDERRVGKECRS